MLSSGNRFINGPGFFHDDVKLNVIATLLISVAKISSVRKGCFCLFALSCLVEQLTRIQRTCLKSGQAASPKSAPNISPPDASAALRKGVALWEPVFKRMVQWHFQLKSLG